MYDEIYKILSEWLQETVPDYWRGGIAFKVRVIVDENGWPEHSVLDVYTNVPGSLIGKAGSIINKYKAELAERVHCLNITDINIVEVNDFVIKPVDKKKLKKHLRWAKLH